MLKNILFVFLILPVVVFSSHSDSIEYADFCAKQHCINTADGPMRYRDEGKGPVILMIHGVATSGWMFRSFINEYSQKGYRVIVPDMLGFGESDCPDGAIIYDPEHHANRLIELLNSLSISEFQVVTQAEGSLWIAPILRDHPEMIQKTILINPLLNAAGLTNKNQLSIGFLAKLGVFNMNWRASSYVKNYLSDNKGLDDLSEMEEKGYLAGIEANKFAGIIGHFEYLTSGEFLHHFHYPSSEKPLLMIVGSNLTSLNWENQYTALNWPPSSSKDTVDKIENGSALLTEQFPAVISEKIRSFLADR